MRSAELLGTWRFTDGCIPSDRATGTSRSHRAWLYHRSATREPPRMLGKRNNAEEGDDQCCLWALSSSERESRKGKGDTGVRGKQNAFRANARANPYQAYWRDFRSSAAGDK